MLKDLARNIRHVRQRQNLTIEELAAKAECSASHLSQIERGQKEPSLDALAKIAKGLNVRVVSLFNAKGVPVLTTEAFKFLKWMQANKITDADLAKLQKVYMAMKEGA